MARPQLGHARTLVQHVPVLPRRCPAGPEALRNSTVSTHRICLRFLAPPSSLSNKESVVFVLMRDKGTAEVAGGRADLTAVVVPQLMGRRLDYVRFL